MSEEMRPTVKGTGIDFFLEKLRVAGIVVCRIEVICTAGDIRPPYPFQFIAVAQIREGEDDPFDGIGGTPYEAVRNLWQSYLKSEERDRQWREQS